MKRRKKGKKRLKREKRDSDRDESEEEEEAGEQATKKASSALRKRGKRPLVLTKALTQEPDKAGPTSGRADRRQNSSSAGNALMWVMACGFAAGVVGSRYYYRKELSKRDEKYHNLLGLYSKHELSDNQSWVTTNPTMIGLFALLPVVVFAGFLYQQQLLFKRKEKERKLSQRITYVVGGALPASFVLVRAFQTFSQKPEDMAGSANPLLVGWRSLGFETKIVIGICGFLAVVRRLGGGPPEASAPRPPRAPSRHRHHRHPSRGQGGRAHAHPHRRHPSGRHRHHM